MTIKTAGELRGFLAEVLAGIRDGSIGVSEAMAIAKVSAQINQSLAVEVNTALQLQKLGKGQPEAGSMQIANGSAMALEHREPSPPAPQPVSALKNGGGTWCDQCDMRVSDEQIAGCKSRFCKVKAPADA